MLLFTRHPARTNFIFDEQEALLANPYVRSIAEAEPKFRWVDAFYRDFWGLGPERSIGSYRPIPNLVWRALWGLGARDQTPVPPSLGERPLPRRERRARVRARLLADEAARRVVDRRSRLHGVCAAHGGGQRRRRDRRRSRRDGDTPRAPRAHAKATVDGARGLPEHAPRPLLEGERALLRPAPSARRAPARADDTSRQASPLAPRGRRVRRRRGGIRPLCRGAAEDVPRADPERPLRRGERSQGPRRPRLRRDAPLVRAADVAEGSAEQPARERRRASSHRRRAARVVARARAGRVSAHAVGRLLGAAGAGAGDAGLSRDHPRRSRDGAPVPARGVARDPVLAPSPEAEPRRDSGRR